MWSGYEQTCIIERRGPGSLGGRSRAHFRVLGVEGVVFTGVQGFRVQRVFKGSRV